MTLLVILGFVGGVVLVLVCCCIIFKALGPELFCKLLCCPFKCLVKICRCACKELPSWCHHCADENNAADSELIRRREEMDYALAKRRRKKKYKYQERRHRNQIEMNEKMGMDGEDEDSDTELDWNMKKRQQRGKSRCDKYVELGMVQATKLDHKKHCDKVSVKHTVYFNVPGLTSIEYFRFGGIEMPKHIPFSLAGNLLTTKDPKKFLFKISSGVRGYNKQYWTCDKGGKFTKLPRGKELKINVSFFSILLPDHVAHWYISEEQVYSCINQPGSADASDD